jgi:hypothetical protein
MRNLVKKEKKLLGFLSVLGFGQYLNGICRHGLGIAEGFVSYLDLDDEST